MTTTDLTDWINSTIKNHPEVIKATCSLEFGVDIQLWGGSITLHDLTEHGSGKFYLNDSSG